MNLRFISLTFLVSICLFLFSLNQVLAQEQICSTGIKYNVWSGLKNNKDVIAVQKLLIKEKYLAIKPTANFFDQTKKAVYNWQVNHGLNPTGIVGSLTRQAMNQVICHGGNNSSLEYHLAPTVSPELLASTTKSVILNIPLFEQSYPLSCEVASLQMALAYRGVDSSQDTLAREVGIAQPFTQSFVAEKLIWGDPDEAFVGDIKGYMRKLNGEFVGATGWGVNNGPIGKLASLYRPGSFAKKQATVGDIKLALDKHNPVIFWHVRGGKPDANIVYTTVNGKSVTMVQDHVALIVGYIEKNDMTTYVINDPHFGRYYLPETELLAWWGAYNNDLVVVS